MTNTTLISLFDSQKENLTRQLNGMLLPKDSEKIKKIVSDYLQQLFDSDGEFRMGLTQAEDYILNAALSLLNAQQEISNAVLSQSEKANIPPIGEHTPMGVKEEASDLSIGDNTFLNTKINASTSLLGSGGGAFIGRFIGGGWGAVFGAIAGTAITIYLSNYKTNSFSKNSGAIKPHVTKSNDQLTGLATTPINVEQFISITRKICESVDNLIDTFRAQIRRVVNKYESQEKPTLEREYLPLLEELQSLIGCKRAHLDDEKFVKKISDRIEDIVETIENYNLSVVDYNGDNAEYFINLPSPNTEVIKQVFPAIIKGEHVVLKGKLFVPENFND